MNLQSTPAISRLRLRTPLAWIAITLALAAPSAFADAPVASNVELSGTFEVGQTVSGQYTYSDPEGDPEGASTYRWLRSPFCANFFLQVIPGATTQQYTLTNADQGRCVIFEVTPVANGDSDGDGIDETVGAAVRSPESPVIAPANQPPSASNVAITGTPEVGFTLAGSYTYSDPENDAEGASTYRWLRDGQPISGATALTYAPVVADVGARLRFEVTPVAQTGASPGSPAQSAQTDPIRPANTPPTASNVQVSGTPEAGFTLTGSYDYADADGDNEGASQYRWLRNGSPIGGASDDEYLLTANDVGATIRFEVTPVAATGVSPGTPVQSPPTEPIRPANTAPFATNVAISGSGSLGSTLTGTYTYNDADGDPEADSEFRWLRDGQAINGATDQQYMVVAADVGAEIRFEVTPEAETGVSPGAPAVSPPLGIDNEPPTINGQDPLETDEDTSLTLTIDDFDVSDPDNDADDLTLIVLDGNNYSRNGNTITPDQDFNGTLTVPVQVNDGFENSAVFNATVTVNAVNDVPEIVRQIPRPIVTAEDTSVTISLADNLEVDDPDHDFPADFTLTLEDGDNYTIAGTVVTPDENFNGRLRVPAIVTDAAGASSDPFILLIDVAAENDAPFVVAPIDDVTAVENSPFDLDVSGNFDDVEGDTLTYAATWSPSQPPNLAFDPDTGVFSGTPLFEDTEAPGPVYNVVVTATDPDGESIGDAFVLTISALNRANLALDIAVTPDTGEPGDEFLWTFTSTNPVGPQAGANVELTGTFTGTGVTAIADGAALCSFTSSSARDTDFTCTIGGLPVGQTSTITIRTTVDAVTEVLVAATTESSESLPIDPNPADNTRSRAIGVGDAFSIGAAQSVGSVDALSIAAGDIDGDGRPDLVVGTAAGQPVQVFLADAPRESCNCFRDFIASPLSVPSTGANRGIALADFDNNGTLDVAVATDGGQPDEVYANDGNGNFVLMATLEGTFGQAIATGDFNNDGNVDIVVAALGENPVYLGDGSGGFVLESSLGDGDSRDVVVGRFTNDGLDDVIFANNDDDSRLWRRRSGGGFTSQERFDLNGVSAVAAADLNGDGSPDLVFARATADGRDVPSNPVYLNDGDGDFGNPVESLTISPTLDVQIGDVNQDGSPDLLFVSATGVHQVWLASGGTYTLAPQQIIDLGAIAAVTGDFGEIAEADAGGPDIVLAGASGAGVSVYLNDGSGTLGRGDAVAPELTLVGEATVSVPAGGSYTDQGATAIDNIDGDISRQVVVTSNVNTAVVGTYTVTYNVSDFGGNPAPSVSRTVSVQPATGAGGGGGGGLSMHTVVALMMLLAGVWLSTGYARQSRRRAAYVPHMNQRRNQ